MRGFDIKQIPMRSFQISGLTAKWGIGGGRSPIWDNNLIGRWDARSFPDGALATIPNTATMADKAPDLTVTGATMASGTLQFDGVDDYASSSAFAFPERFTVFWDIDWLGSKYISAGILHSPDLFLYNFAPSREIRCFIKSTTSGYQIHNTDVGLSTNGNIYAPDGSVTPFGGTIGTSTGNAPLFIARTGANYTQLGFRQLLIFNKELSQAEVNDVLRVMFPA
ncbi:hypothetical protein EMB1_00013 [Bacteroides phage EMB1]|nr:hypothetical protein EMB1_00013 [Bacteroides phage EMB1]USR81546.1 hypothetical protein EMB2_00027 [Bacteroides phage EMB2]